MSRNTRTLFVAFVLLVALATCFNSALGQRSQQSSLNQVRFEAKDYEQFAPYWTAEPGWRTELQMRNNRAQGDLTITPVLRTANGVEFPLAAVVVAPNEIKSVDVSQVLTTQAPQLSGSYGSVSFRYHAEGMRNLYAAVMVYDDGHPIAFHFDAFVEATDFDGGSREGVWWLPSASAKEYLILTNNNRGALITTLHLYDAKGSNWNQQITLAPRSTNRYSIRDLLRKGGVAGTYGGFTVDVKSRVGSLDTAYLLFDETAGFSALMKTFDRNPHGKIEQRFGFPEVKQWTTRAPMLALTNPDPALDFPQGTVLQPQIFVRNMIAVPVTAWLRFNWRADADAGSATDPVLHLRPYETQRIDVAALQKNRVIPAEARWTSVELSLSGQPNDVMAVAASYDSTLRYGTQTPFNAQLTYRWEGGEWRVDATHNSIITAGNGGAIPIKARFTVYYDGGKKRYDLEEELQPHQQMWLDVGKLIHERLPDKNGLLLPPDLTTGSYEVQDLTDRGVGNLFEGKIIVDKTYGHAAYGCATCCGYTTAYMYYDPIGVVTELENNQDVWAHDNCTGTSGSVLDAFPPDGWGTGDHAIATANGHVLTGIAPGSTNNSAQGTLIIGNVESHYCPATPQNPSGSANVVQVQITSADLESNQVGVTLSGPSGTSGTLEVIAIGVNNQPQVTYDGGAAVGPGSYTVAFNRPGMPADTYSSVKAIWNYDPIPATNTFNLTRNWLVLGAVRHSQYNTPYESACTASPQKAWTFSSNCTFTQVSLKSDFVSQTYINGTGVSQSHGILKYSASCTNYPSGANSQNSFLTVSNITGACNTTLSGGVSVATYPSPNVGNPYGCGDDILLVTSSNTNEALKDAADYCPACSGGFNGTNGHIDDYSSSQACSGNAVGDLGNYWTADAH